MVTGRADLTLRGPAYEWALWSTTVRLAVANPHHLPAARRLVDRELAARGAGGQPLPRRLRAAPPRAPPAAAPPASATVFLRAARGGARRRTRHRRRGRPHPGRRARRAGLRPRLPGGRRAGAATASASSGGPRRGGSASTSTRAPGRQRPGRHPAGPRRHRQGLGRRPVRPGGGRRAGDRGAGLARRRHRHGRPGPDGGWRVLVRRPARRPRRPGHACPRGPRSRPPARGRGSGAGRAGSCTTSSTRPPACRSSRCGASVTVAAGTCVEANTWSTAAVVQGRGAPALLARQGTSRPAARRGRAAHVGAWPAAAEVRGGVPAAEVALGVT